MYNIEYFYGSEPHLEIKHKGKTLIIESNNTDLSDEDYVLKCVKEKKYKVKKFYIGISGNWVGR